MIEVGGVVLISRTVDGSFPDYKQIIPKEFKTEVIILKEDLLRALKASVAFSDKFNQTVFSILPQGKVVSIKSKSNEIGEGCVNLDAAISGDEMEISFNHKYVIDCLNFIKSDSISLSFSGDAKPALLRGVSDHSFRYVVMPMNR
jgi:DNA polymerase-3 subunit beta